MSNQPPFMGVNGTPVALPTIIKQEYVYPSYESHQNASSRLLRDAFMLTNVTDDDPANPTTGGAGTSSCLLLPLSGGSQSSGSPSAKQRHIYESPEARGRRLARNAERMRERRSNETDEEYRIRREKMAASNRQRRMQENEIERVMRHLRDAARQRLRRAMETPEQRSKRLEKLAERSRMIRLNETPEQRAERNRKCLENNKLRYQRKQQGLIEAEKGKSAAIDTLPQPSSGLQTPVPNHHHHNLDKKTHIHIQDEINNGHHSMVASPSISFDNFYSSYQSFKGSPFPDLPPHVAPNQPKYYGHIQNFVSPQPSSLHYIPPIQQQQQHQPSQTHPATTGNTSATTTTTSSSQQQHQQQPPQQHPALHMNHIHQQPASYSGHIVNSHPLTVVAQTVAQPEITRGRPIKLLPSNNYQTIAPAHQQEAVRQQKLNHLLEEQINIIMASPKQGRGRPSLPADASDSSREERLRRMREARKMQLAAETPEQRAARLKDLAERARKRRISLLSNETDEERRERLKRQAEYARERRETKYHSPNAHREAEQRAKDLYAKQHQP